MRRGLVLPFDLRRLSIESRGGVNRQLATFDKQRVTAVSLKRREQEELTKGRKETRVLSFPAGRRCKYEVQDTHTERERGQPDLSRWLLGFHRG